ncbi:MAG: 2-oxoacid:ferredoxin oxidoreductase subunit beta [Myxococcota bacterium]
MPAMSPNHKLTRKDFASDQEVRWCPGCGDYAILAAIQRTLPTMGVRRENTVFVSGIGCSSRFPYYMNTYGFHTIHGRAPALATGLKLANPELDVWVVTGDGDGLSIGGNHLLHVLRRNVDLKILLFNNRIYGLTKGQYSPTSLVGQMSPSTPFGSVDQPVWPCMFALGSNARFVARGYDTSKKLADVFQRAHEHRGASFIEILQNCPVYNDGQFDDVTDRKLADEHQLWVEHGKPLVFGKGGSKGVRMRPGRLELEVVELGNGVSENDLLVHDETNRTQAFLLAQLEMPVAMGVLYCDPTESYDHGVREQIRKVREQKGEPDLERLLRSGHTWTVEPRGEAE